MSNDIRDLKARLDTLEGERKSAKASHQRLKIDQKDLVNKVQAVQGNVDQLALTCSAASSKTTDENTTCAQSLKALTSQVNDLTNIMEKLETKLPDSSMGSPGPKIQPPLASAGGQFATTSTATDPIQAQAAPTSGLHPIQTVRSQNVLTQGAGTPNVKAGTTPAAPTGLGTYNDFVGMPDFSLNTRPPQPALNTVSEKPVVFETSRAAPMVGQQTQGNHCPGIPSPQSTIHPIFTSSVDYRTYRLPNTRAELSEHEVTNLHKIKKNIDNAITIPTFSGIPAINLLSFLRTFVRAMVHRNQPEAVAANLLPLYTTDDANRVVSRCIHQYDAVNNPYSHTYPHMVHALIERYLTDDVLQEAEDKVMLAHQEDSETEKEFCDRLLNAVQECANVFTDMTVVRQFIRGLPGVTRLVVSERLRNLPMHQQDNINIVRGIAMSEGTTHRARVKEADERQKAIAAKFMTPQRQVKSRVLSINEPSGSVLAVTPATQGRLVPYDQAQEVIHTTPAAYRQFMSPESSPLVPPRNMVPMAIGGNGDIDDTLGMSYSFDDAVNIIDTLQPILAVGLPPADAQSLSTVSDDEEQVNPLNLKTVPTPSLTPEQIQQALQVVPDDYWAINCWVCRDDGHTMFRCPFLLPAQRIYFAYRYYMWQVQQQPHMRKFLADRFAARQQGRLAQGRQGGAPARGLPPITQVAQAQAGRRNNFSQRPRSNWGSGNAGSKAPGERPWLPPNAPRAARTPRFAPQDAHRYTVAILQRPDATADPAQETASTPQAAQPTAYAATSSSSSEEKA